MSHKVGGSSPSRTTIFIDLWCNGSTRDFGSLGLGSNPGRSATKNKLIMANRKRTRSNTSTQQRIDCYMQWLEWMKKNAYRKNR